MAVAVGAVVVLAAGAMVAVLLRRRIRTG